MYTHLNDSFRYLGSIFDNRAFNLTYYIARVQEFIGTGQSQASKSYTKLSVSYVTPSTSAEHVVDRKDCRILVCQYKSSIRRGALPTNRLQVQGQPPSASAPSSIPPPVYSISPSHIHPPRTTTTYPPWCHRSSTEGKYLGPANPLAITACMSMLL